MLSQLRLNSDDKEEKAKPLCFSNDKAKVVKGESSESNAQALLQ